ncbi:glycosyltransferase family 4 protein [Marivita sp. GX14005]|uniref:glycosyltransferase family 4 protein n=1 Tax=Marivita sp. GX14005 TaxID=2942276 RepID=UPI00201A02E4|nr:glycosyltransferase family 4 protein [Marivita sp. GX14005]MCL3883146.1 glycosyltransferase family 4 protein [Marivita sp. GX14005]
MTHSPAGKIGYVLKRYPRFSETFIVTEILAHEAAGQEIEIFALRPVEETHFQDMLGRVRAPVTRVPDSFRNADALWSLIERARDTLPSGWTALHAMTGAAGRDVAQAIIVALTAHERGITHLHAHFGTVSTSVARLAAALAGITYSFTMHAKDIYHDYDTPVHLDEKLRDAAGAVTVSDYNRAYLRDRFGADAAHVARIYNGLDLTRLPYAAPNSGGEILAIGRLVEKKGFDVLIDAMALMRDAGHTVPCRIIGSGDQEAALRARIDAAGLQNVVRLDGPRPQAEVFDALRRASMLVCPCVVGADGNRDGLPTVLLEAMALGTPCISTDVVGIPELVRDNDTGLCVPERDAEALADAMARLSGDPALAARLSRSARALIEAEFDITRNAAHLRDLFAACIASQTPQKGAA